MIYKEQDILKAISESFGKYLTHGARSTEKLKPLHGYIAGVINSIWGDDFEYFYISDKKIDESYMCRGKLKIRQVKRREKIVKGKYYNKAIDICVTLNSEPICCVGIKFVTSNYKQNANNYFESMMGETVNVQRQDIPYFQVLILRDPMPYFSDGGVLKKYEHISKDDLQKYLNLHHDKGWPHRPDSIGILLVDVDQRTGSTKKVIKSDNLSSELLGLLYDSLSLDELFANIDKYKRYYISKTNG